MYIKLDATKLNTPNTAGDDVATLVTSRSSSASSDDGTPPTYGYPLAVITVANGFTSITNGNIQDVRSQVLLNTGTSTSTSGWQAQTAVPTTITALGNRSYTVLFPSVDLTGTVSTGMRLKLTRTVTAPTQCTSLNGTTQYYSRASASVAGMTFTDDFVVSAWVKLSSYAAGTIASRFDGTSGWVLDLQSNGTVRLSGFNAGAANVSRVDSYQSVPLNKWVHIAAQLDMSAFTATTTTSYVMIDGVDVPAFVTRAGTNPTALVQAGNLNIGAYNGASEFFPGKLAQVAIYSAKVTQATIKASMNQTLTGSETSLISAYSFNNSINDLSANANNLTANGSATATNADTPFTQTQTGVTAGTTNYAIITAASFSTNTTLTVQVPEGDTIPTSGGVSAVAYSTQKVPYGFPSQRTKWSVLFHHRASASQGTPTANTWYNPSSQLALNVPVGSWKLRAVASIYVNRASGAVSVYMTLADTAGNTENDRLYSTYGEAVAQTDWALPMVVTRDLDLAAAANYYLNFKTATAGITSIFIRSDNQTSVIEAECSHL